MTSKEPRQSAYIGPPRPAHAYVTPRLSLLGPSDGPVIEERVQDNSIGAMDLKVKVMLNTGCSPNNYIREELFDQ